MYNQQRVFTNIKAFGKPNFYSSDSTKDTHARIIYSTSRCSKNSQGNYLLYNQAKTLKINETELNMRYDDTLISSGTLQNLVLSDVNVVKKIVSDKQCNIYDPTSIEPSLSVPFYYKYEIDPCGSLYGNRSCEKNKYKRYIQLNNPIKSEHSDSLTSCISHPFNACNNNK